MSSRSDLKLRSLGLFRGGHPNKKKNKKTKMSITMQNSVTFSGAALLQNDFLEIHKIAYNYVPFGSTAPCQPLMSANEKTHDRYA